MCSHSFTGFVVVPVCCLIIHIVTPRTGVVASTCSYDCVASPQGPRLTPQSFAGWTKVISKTTSLKRKVHVSLVCVCCDCRFHTTPPPYLMSYVLVLKPYVPSYDFSYGCRTQHMHISFVWILILMFFNCCFRRSLCVVLCACIQTSHYTCGTCPHTHTIDSIQVVVGPAIQHIDCELWRVCCQRFCHWLSQCWWVALQLGPGHVLSHRQASEQQHYWPWFATWFHNTFICETLCHHIATMFEFCGLWNVNALELLSTWCILFSHDVNSYCFPCCCCFAVQYHRSNWELVWWSWKSKYHPVWKQNRCVGVVASETRSYVWSMSNKCWLCVGVHVLNHTMHHHWVNILGSINFILQVQVYRLTHSPRGWWYSVWPSFAFNCQFQLCQRHSDVGRQCRYSCWHGAETLRT